ncbi:MAG: 4-(cytidine 5'-diphospho)-2-C-methyl-D-erythritol kinase [Clostridia bacterium]|nr:4-(cytidine 5'-diphospho)-2-C-methyl-D-erythritol kinase [Clostridia bacterium]
MKIIESAHAKINLYLDVFARRDDGFHDILTVMHSVGLCDELTVTAEYADKSSVVLLVSSDYPVPSGRDNLAYRAAEKYIEATGITARVVIELKKKIPMEAGLGGGSSDAAAVLRAMNKIFGTLGEGELQTLALSLGSDVPFCLVGGTYLCDGRGVPKQKIDLNSLNLLIVLGRGRITAKEGYDALDALYSDFDGTVQKPTKDLTVILTAFSDGGIKRDALYNVFESISLSPVAEALKLRDLLLASGAQSALMSGSGPAVFGIFKTKSEAEKASATILKLGHTVYLTESI